MQLCNCRIIVIREDVIVKSLMTLAWLTSLANIGFIYRNVGTINTYSQEPMKNVHGRFQYQSQGWSTWRVIFARACHRVFSISSISGSCILFTTACVGRQVNHLQSGSVHFLSQANASDYYKSWIEHSFFFLSVTGCWLIYTLVTAYL